MSRIWILFVATLAGLLVFQQADAQESQSSAQVRFGEDRSVVYKACEGDDLRLYLFLPEETAESADRAAIVFFFGGGWVGGTPAQFREQARYLRSRGMVAVLADYRTRKSHNTGPGECVADARSAIRYLRANAADLGIDPAKIVAAGGSAGGHIAAATATLSSFDDPGDDLSISCMPNALVLFNPVFDNGPGQWGHQKVQEYWQSISPAHNIRKGIPPAVVFLGDQDKLISVATAESFRDQMEGVGSKCILHVTAGQGHGFFNFGRNDNLAFIDTVKKMDSFLVKCGMLTGPDSVAQFMEQQPSNNADR